MGPRLLWRATRFGLGDTGPVASFDLLLSPVSRAGRGCRQGCEKRGAVRASTRTLPPRWTCNGSSCDTVSTFGVHESCAAAVICSTTRAPVALNPSWISLANASPQSIASIVRFNFNSTV